MVISLFPLVIECLPRPLRQQKETLSQIISALCWGLALPGPLQMPDGCAFSTEDDTSFIQPAKDVRTGGPNTPSDGFVSFYL